MQGRRGWRVGTKPSLILPLMRNELLRDYGNPISVRTLRVIRGGVPISTLQESAPTPLRFEDAPAWQAH